VINSEQDSGHLLAQVKELESAERTLLAQVKGEKMETEKEGRLGV
jgi:hypothetical protein